MAEANCPDTIKTIYWHSLIKNDKSGSYDHIHYANGEGKPYLLIKGGISNQIGAVWPTVFDSRVEPNPIFDPADAFFTGMAQLRALGYSDIRELHDLILRPDPDKQKWGKLGKFFYGTRCAYLHASDDEAQFRVCIWEGNYSETITPLPTTVGYYHDLHRARAAYENAICNLIANTSYTDVSLWMQQKTHFV